MSLHKNLSLRVFSFFLKHLSNANKTLFTSLYVPLEIETPGHTYLCLMYHKWQQISTQAGSLQRRKKDILR